MARFARKTRKKRQSRRNMSKRNKKGGRKSRRKRRSSRFRKNMKGGRKSRRKRQSRRRKRGGRKSRRKRKMRGGVSCNVANWKESIADWKGRCKSDVCKNKYFIWDENGGINKLGGCIHEEILFDKIAYKYNEDKEEKEQIIRSKEEMHNNRNKQILRKFADQYNEDKEEKEKLAIPKKKIRSIALNPVQGKELHKKYLDLDNVPSILKAKNAFMKQKKEEESEDDDDETKDEEEERDENAIKNNNGDK